jgi:outer membrane receptor protein involved in Fe transport
MLNVKPATSAYVNFNDGYALADLNASHRFSPRIEAVLQVQNLADRYVNDYSASYATMGRQTKLGLRIRP